MEEVTHIKNLVQTALDKCERLELTEPHSAELPDPMQEMKITTLLLKQVIIRLEVMSDRILVG